MEDMDKDESEDDSEDDHGAAKVGIRSYHQTCYEYIQPNSVLFLSEKFGWKKANIDIVCVAKRRPCKLFFI